MLLCSLLSMILLLYASGRCPKQHNPSLSLFISNFATHFGGALLTPPHRSSRAISRHCNTCTSLSPLMVSWNHCRDSSLKVNIPLFWGRVQRNQPFVLFSSVSGDNQIDTNAADFRKNLLREMLIKLGCIDDISSFENAVVQSMIDPTSGYDVKYGKSAIKTCQTFYYPKTVPSYDTVQWQSAAMRTARQIEFLYKRHLAQKTQWIRNHDTTTDTKTYPTLSSADLPRFPFVLLLDNLRSAENVGSIYRTADATRCQEVMTVGITPHPPGHVKIQKSALGAECLVPTQHFSNATAAIEYIKQKYKTYQIIALETTSESIPYTQFPYDLSESSGIVLILGNEVTGVDVSFYLSNHNLDGIIEIPMFGTKNSLNVAVCAPIVLYEILRQRNR